MISYFVKWTKMDDWDVLSLVYSVSPRFYGFDVVFHWFQKKFHSDQKDLVVAVIGSIHS